MAIPLSIEAYLLLNFFMDTLLISLAIRAVGCPIGPKVLVAGFVGAVYALLCEICCAGWVASLPMQGAVMFLMLLISGGLGCTSVKVVTAMAMETLFIGGVLEYVLRRWNGWTAFLAALTLGVMLIVIAQDRRHMGISRLTVRVRVHYQEKMVSFDALIDTGNRLREPFSGLPVLIAEERLLKGLHLRDAIPLRCIPYAGLGGGGFLKAFRPDRIAFACDKEWRTAPEAWVALYPDRMAGDIHALAPPSFALQKSRQSV